MTTADYVVLAAAVLWFVLDRRALGAQITHLQNQIEKLKKQS